MREQKYPPGVRFVFLLVLSAFAAFVIPFADRTAPSSASWAFFAITTLMSLAVFVIAMLPWAKNRRKRTSFSGLALFLSGIAFLAAQISRDRVGWFYFLPVILLACFMMYLTRHGFVPNHQRRPVGMLGYILLGLTFLITPVLTIFSIYVVAETRADEVFLLITSAWLLFSGIILKIAGSEKKNLVSIKPLLFSGELSILFSFPLLFLLLEAESYWRFFNAIAFGSSVIFSLCVL